MAEFQRIYDRYSAEGFLTIYTAFATEAQMNHAIETGLSGAARKAVKGLITLKKIELVPELAGSTLRPDPGAMLLQDLKALFKRRNKLAHPVPHIWEFRSKGNGSVNIKVPKYGHDLPTRPGGSPSFATS